jgi:ribonuclease E
VEGSSNSNASDVSNVTAITNTSTVYATVASTEADAVAPTFASHETPAPSFSSEPKVAATISTTPVPAQSEADFVVAPVVEAVAAPAELPKVEFKALQTTDLAPVLESAGLVWVNTDSQKLAEVRAQIAAEPAVTHAPRQPKPPVELTAGPMVLVETGGKEQTIEK